MYYVYLVRCNDNSLYCGQTKNIEKRIQEHNSSKNISTKYTRGRRPIKLVYVEKCKTFSQALKKEYKIKQLTKKQKELLLFQKKYI